MQKLAFVDLETTGATAASDRITEIGIVSMDPDGHIEEWQQLVNPDAWITPFIEQLTGISNRMVANAPRFSDLAGEVQARLAGRLFIAHNARFDLGFLKAEFARLGIEFAPPSLCTVKLSRALYPAYSRHGLDALIERHGLRANERHRALADAQLVHQFWQKIHVDRDKDEISAAIQSLNPYPNLPTHLSARIFDELPEHAGVCLFYAADGRLLYRSKAQNIRKRAMSRFAAKTVTPEVRQQLLSVARIEWTP